MSNTEQKQKILLKRTTEVDKQPIPSDASHGELFLNIASGANAHNKIATMQIGTNEAIIWSDDAANEKKFALKTELENLIQEVEDSEFVTANALTQINKSAGFTEGGISKLPDQQSLTDAIIDLQNKTQDLEESDPIFTDSPAAGITDDDIENWNNKLDKDGKAVSAQTADFATELTGRLEATSEAFTYRPSAGDKSIKDDNAFIRRVKGNSVVFNQLVKDNGYSNNGVVTTFNNGVFTLAGTPTSTYFNTSEAIPLVLGHTMLLQVFVVANPKNVKARFGDLNQNAYIPIDTGGGIIYTASGLVNHYLGFYESNLKNIDFTGLQIFQMLVDLTAMFGAGNEPTTVEEFRALYPNSYYPYNPGELRNFVCSGIKTVGFNQWDEQWEIGYISIHDGINAPSTTCIRSANFIKCLPDTEYSATKPTRGILIAFYDFSKQYIGNVSTENLFTTPTNCAFIRFFVEYGTTVSTYNHDICINLHHTGYRDGEYEPYKEVTHELPLSQITNGEPLRYVYNSSAGEQYDEINETEYIKRIGVVDLGTLDWSWDEVNSVFKTYGLVGNGNAYRFFCSKYTTTNYGFANMADKTIRSTNENLACLGIKDSSFGTDYAALKASLSGVLLHYELAEPIVTPIETPIDFNYYVEDFGTEEAILAENSAPFNADIIYQFNAVDRIRQNDLNIDRIEKELLLKSDTGHTHSEYATTTALNDLISDIEDNKLDKDGKAVSAQTADFATDLSGRVEATPELFTYRPSAGDKSIKDDNAFIRRVKGNSVVFNQILAPRSLTETSNGITVTQDGTGKVVVKGTATSRAQVSVGTAQIITGHKYAYWGLVGDGANKFYWTDQTVNADTGKGVIAQPTYASGERYFILNVLQGVTVDFTFYPQVSDLTAMFGAGNEPTTVEEFRALYPNSYYPYNPGELRNLACSGIKTVGFNQWDEQWERGTLSSTGQNDNTSTTIRSKNYIPVIGNEDYYVGITTEGLDNMYYLTVCWYDSNKNFISKIYCNREVVTSPVNAAYMRFGTNTNTYIYGITYNHDICINLHHTGYRDGEYEPYKEVTHALPLSQITNGEPLRKAGSVYDEINETHYIKRVGVVDLGSYDWYETPNGTFKTVVNIPDIKAVELESNYTCKKYIGVGNPSTIYNGTADNLTISTNEAGRIYIRDDAYKTGTADAAVTALKASLSGVLLHYELAEPIVTPIETPIDFNYYVEDFGTEEALLQEDSAPFRADIVYQFNATDRIRENSLNIKKLSKTQKDYLPLTGGTMSGQVNSQDIKPVEDNTYQLGDSTHKYKNVFSDFFTGNLEGNAKTATVATDLSGRVEATPEVFTYRPSAGDKSIKDDNAFIRRVKGNSVAFNQMLKNGDFATTTDWSPYQSANVSLNWDNGLTVTSNYAGTGGDPISVKQAIAQSFILGHKYFVHFEFSTSNTSLTPLVECFNALHSNEQKVDYVQSGNHYYSINNVKDTRTTVCYLKAMGTKAVGDTWTFKDVMIIDLTAMFGTGNEPTTVDEFRALYPNSYYPYNTGELRNLVCSGIKTVGFNQWDGKVEVGYIRDRTGEVYGNQNYLCTDFIRVIPNQKYYINTEQTDGRWGAWYDANKNHIAGIIGYDQVYAPPTAAYVRLTIKTADSGNPDAFCINLHHTGYRDGEYEPYKEVTHALPLSQITNGEPLRKAGSVYDEINETEYIRRVGVVDLGSLAWVNAANNVFACTEMPNMIVTTDTALRLDGLFCTKYAIDTNLSIDATMSEKTMKRNNGWLYIKDTSFTDVASFKASLSGVILNYELAEPIVKPIETPIDFNYYVEDFGTEEAILAENSAPFNADIIYQFNAVDRIRQNDLNIDRLDKELLLKQDNIEDLETIRNNATSGAAAYGWGNHADAGYLSGYTEQYTGTITGIKMNDELKGTSGVVDLGTVLTSTAIKVNSASTVDNATTSTKAIQDGDGNVIATTYSTKEELSGAVNDIIEEIINNELVTSRAISTINTSAGFNEDGTSALPNKQSLTDAIVELQNKTQDLNVYMSNGSNFAASDRTLKTHIEDIDGSLDKIKKIPKVYFHWNNDEDKKRQMGTYAQDLEEVYPELVTKDKDGIRAVAYDRLGVVALAGIDKLYDMVQELMKKNDELEKRIKELEENK